MKLKETEQLAYTITELNLASRVGKNTIYLAIGRGELKAKRIGSRKFIVSAEEARRWLNETTD